MSIPKFLLNLLAIWDALVIILGLFKLHIFFPFNIAGRRANAVPPVADGKVLGFYNCNLFYNSIFNWRNIYGGFTGCQRIF